MKNPAEKDRSERTLEEVIDRAAERELTETDGGWLAGIFTPIVAAAVGHLATTSAEAPATQLQASLSLDALTAERLMADWSSDETDSEFLESVEADLADADPEGLEGLMSRFFEPLYDIGGFDSSSFAVMTAGSGNYEAVQRDQRVFFRYEGNEETGDEDLRFAYRVGDAEARRAALLGLLTELAWPGGWIASDLEAEFAAEIRAAVEDSDFYTEWLTSGRELALEVDPDFLEPHVEEFARINGVSGTEARRVLNRLVEDLDPRDQPERDALWRIWLDFKHVYEPY